MRWDHRSRNLKNGGNGAREYRKYPGTMNVPQVSESHLCLSRKKVITRSIGSPFQNGGLNSEEGWRQQ